MYLAELHGKLSSRIEGMEDVLTSNVFSFLKYSTRKLFLKGYLGRLGFAVSDRQADDAEFLFWPRLEEETEPDLVIIVGNYYILVEAKYFSGFAEGTKKTKAQLLREIDEGRLDAKNYGKDFNIVIERDLDILIAHQTLLHEIIHTIENIHDMNLPEWQVEILSTGLLYIIKNNKNLIKYLQIKEKKE